MIEKKNLTTKLTQKKIYTMNRAYFVKREPLIQRIERNSKSFLFRISCISHQQTSNNNLIQ